MLSHTYQLVTTIPINHTLNIRINKCINNIYLYENIINNNKKWQLRKRIIAICLSILIHSGLKGLSFTLFYLYYNYISWVFIFLIILIFLTATCIASIFLIDGCFKVKGNILTLNYHNNQLSHDLVHVMERCKCMEFKYNQLNTIKNALLNYNDRLNYIWKKRIAFLGGKKRPESTIFQFLNSPASKDIKPIILKLANLGPNQIFFEILRISL
jgi:hypothetical protein